MISDIKTGSTVIPGQYLSNVHQLRGTTIHKVISGRGTTIVNLDTSGNSLEVIVSTILGKYIIDKDHQGNTLISVIPKSDYDNLIDKSSNSLKSPIPLDLTKPSNNLPKENDIVLVKITKLTPKQAYCELLSVEARGNIVQDSGIGANGEIAHNSIGAGGGSQGLTNQSTIASSQSTAINAVATDLGESYKGVIRSQDIRSTDRDKVKVIDSFKPGDIVRAIIISLGDGSNYYLSTARNDLGVIYAKSENGAGDSMFPIDWQHMISSTTGTIENRKCAKPFNTNE